MPSWPSQSGRTSTASQHCQPLAEVIMKLGRDAAALLFLGIDQHAAELLWTLLGQFEPPLLVEEVHDQPFLQCPVHRLLRAAWEGCPGARRAHWKPCPALITPGHRIAHGTRQPPSQFVSFSPRNAILRARQIRRFDGLSHGDAAERTIRLPCWRGAALRVLAEWLSRSNE